MSTAISIQGHVLDAMLNFAADPRNFLTPSVLSEVLVEITPESLRLVATESHILGILHLTAMNSYGLEIACHEPTSLILPVSEFKPLLRDKRCSTIRLTIDGTQVTVGNSAGVMLTVTGRAADEYPNYHRIIPGHTMNAVSGFSVDAALLGRFATFAKALRKEPTLSLCFHADTDLISVYLKNISAFYGVIAPCKHESPALPEWLNSPGNERVVQLREIDCFNGIDEAGNTWTQFAGDELAEHAPSACAMCGHVIHTGWLCLDTGKNVCHEHVMMPRMPVMMNEAIPA